MRLSRTLALGASVLALAVVAERVLDGWGQQARPSRSDPWGSTKRRIMAEAYAQVLEANGYTVNRDGIGLGDRTVLLPALESGQIDLQPEYIGSGLGADYGGTPTGDAAANQAALQDDPERQGRRHHRPRLHPGAGPERVRRPQGDGRRAQPRPR